MITAVGTSCSCRSVRCPRADAGSTQSTVLGRGHCHTHQQHGAPHEMSSCRPCPSRSLDAELHCRGNVCHRGVILGFSGAFTDSCTICSGCMDGLDLGAATMNAAIRSRWIICHVVTRFNCDLVALILRRPLRQALFVLWCSTMFWLQSLKIL